MKLKYLLFHEKIYVNSNLISQFSCSFRKKNVSYNDDAHCEKPKN